MKTIIFTYFLIGCMLLTAISCGLISDGVLLNPDGNGAKSNNGTIKDPSRKDITRTAFNTLGGPVSGNTSTEGDYIARSITNDIPIQLGVDNTPDISSGLNASSTLCGSITINGVNYAGGSESSGFEVADGYVFGASEAPAPNPGGSVAGHRWAVEFYNSGLFNSLSGYSAVSNSGQWTSPIGGADDNRGYLTKHTYTAVSAYDRFGNNAGHFLGIIGPGNASQYVEYEYTFDANDFNAVPPSNLTNGDLKYNIWFCPSSNETGRNASNDNIYHEMKFYGNNGSMVLSVGTGGMPRMWW